MMWSMTYRWVRIATGILLLLLGMFMIFRF